MNNAQISKSPLGVMTPLRFILQPLIVSLKSIAYSTPFSVQTTPATPDLHEKSDRLMLIKRMTIASQKSTLISEILRKHLSFSVLDNGVAYLNVNPIAERMSNAVAYWGIAFLLSNIVRYEPIAISKLVSSDDSAYSLLNELCNKSMRIFPNIVYNMITERNTRFSNKI